MTELTTVIGQQCATFKKCAHDVKQSPTKRRKDWTCSSTTIHNVTKTSLWWP